ncbi:class I SAM-dependent methyltransferase [Hymenobacter sp. BT507]|uniref:Class I SAM-dependent methyltransferase n=1 Tax=Hymenobacter citatus TaxID=2763506 RepID=A0ABR7MJA8_9BACT|nr:class I SAM-dependent methyltransferase [Hymenobacter citatus]MBC6610633.1 class I SAM-dependent methyltransferase [Hymenobacter citatus]
MKLRLQLFEFEDLPWFPEAVRAGMMDYLRFMISGLKIYQPIVSLLREALQHTNQTQLLELCAGAGGGTEGVWRELQATGLPQLGVILTDLYPQPTAWQHLHERTGGGLTFMPTPVDATRVPATLSGFRVVFSAFHHFSPAVAEAILADAVRQRAGIGVFEGAGKHWHEVALAAFVMPIALLCITPFVRPFRWSRLLFTYLIPLIPVCTIWDGVVSILRLYPPDQLLALTRRADPTGAFEWRVGKARHWSGSQVLYLTGWPKHRVEVEN